MYLSDLFESVRRVRPRSNIDSIALVVAWFVGLLVFCFLVGSLVIW